MKTNQSGQPGPASWSNASGTFEAAMPAEQSNGAYPYGNGQNIDQPTGYGFASQWERSNEDQIPSDDNFGNREYPDSSANFAHEVQESAKPGKPILTSSRDGNLETGDSAPGDSPDSRSRTGVQNERGDDETPQGEQQQGQHVWLYRVENTIFVEMDF